MSDPKVMELKAKAMSIVEMIENTRGLSQGVTLEAEMLTSIAISMKRIADAAELFAGKKKLK